MTLSELEGPGETETGMEDDLDISMNVNLRLEKVCVAVFDERLLSYNNKVHPSLSVNLDVRGSVT